MLYPSFFSHEAMKATRKEGPPFAFGTDRTGLSSRQRHEFRKVCPNRSFLLRPGRAFFSPCRSKLPQLINRLYTLGSAPSCTNFAPLSLYSIRPPRPPRHEQLARPTSTQIPGEQVRNNEHRTSDTGQQASATLQCWVMVFDSVCGRVALDR